MKHPKSIIGWREWLSLPDLGINKIKAKIDTGARTSALHAFQIKPYTKSGQSWVEFRIHPKQNDNKLVLDCLAEVIDERDVVDSGGHCERRIVIASTVVIGQDRRLIELTLTDRDNMKFRMLLGRTAIRGGYVVDPGKSFLLSSGIKSR